jgi:hypothetical protein
MIFTDDLVESDASIFWVEGSLFYQEEGEEFISCRDDEGSNLLGNIATLQ